jgi:hypothetical protein
MVVTVDTGHRFNADKLRPSWRISRLVPHPALMRITPFGILTLNYFPILEGDRAQSSIPIYLFQLFVAVPFAMNRGAGLQDGSCANLMGRLKTNGIRVGREENRAQRKRAAVLADTRVYSFVKVEKKRARR